jgi:hypothetical protein
MCVVFSFPLICHARVFVISVVCERSKFFSFLILGVHSAEFCESGCEGVNLMWSEELGRHTLYTQGTHEDEDRIYFLNQMLFYTTYFLWFLLYLRWDVGYPARHRG